MKLMFGNILVVGIIAAALLLTLFLRSNASLVFLILCSGVVLNMMIGDDAVIIANSGLANVNHGIESLVRTGLILVPALVGLLFLRHAIPKNRLALQIPSALAFGAAVVLLVAPQLNSVTILDAPFYDELKKYQAAVFIIGALSGLLLNTMARQKHPHEQHHGKH